MIINGEAVPVGEARYQLALYRHGTFICGAALIAPRTAITAGHCVYGFKDRPQLFRIRYATLYRNSGAELPVSRIILHPYYNTSTFDYDVAVLCTETPFTAGVNAQVVEIAAAAPVAGTRA
ncbi:PREDICTED: trypsin theta-like, partial [Rhagoletis zephyria]|uniref:trypsin theta-like n=1 Tax=Rhagoletis zephyria TaxID=28612 RepID=UPI000811366B